ncbi:MAG: aspartate-semialdehyde dehydrogenase [Halobacteriovorax sp.]|nr:aspartate-semialdehyde dehydrogenase [Halobacteriovorax sp.]|tara:strand:+ start:98727 stop:99839 length:1113 start_codon:yes stop_codon:yes gene_type:complete
MKKVGLVGWRGMVGSVLMGRMLEEKDFDLIEPCFFSTSQTGQKAPAHGGHDGELKDASSIEELSKMDIIITCQGGSYTNEIYPELRKSGWGGYWIDAASALRMKEDSTLILDPVNLEVIKSALHNGKKDFIGPNCTVSLMLMAVGGLFNHNAIEWLTSMTYQAASGAGAKNMLELLNQMKTLGTVAEHEYTDPAKTILDVDKTITASMRSKTFPSENFGAPLAGSLIPWIDVPVEAGQTKEEWKGISETNKILGSKNLIPIDGTCVRMGAMRCHSQALTIKLNKNIPIDEIESMIKEANDWVKFVPNNKEETLKYLCPTFATGTLEIPVGRVRKMNLGEEYLNVFTVGDQLLWGAAEPLRRMLRIILESE